jgi:pimeloyl-ACP methyl ester carboxylesterase
VNEGHIHSEAYVTRSADTFETIEEPFWFGPADRPLFGWLARPVGGLAHGAVLCAPPIGREARGGRRGIRALAISLAARGYVTLRFDFDGTGDSAGGFDDVGRDELWIRSIVQATNHLRSLGFESISAVGMRLGATLIGVAAAREKLNLSAVVLWDPCESGRSFLRELNALEALRRSDFQIVAGAPIETSEFVFSTRAVEEIRRLNLSETEPTALGERALVVLRSDRAMSKRLRSHLTHDSIEWQTTNEQATLLDVDPIWAVLPTHTVDAIVTWLSAPLPPLRPFVVPSLPKDAVVASETDRLVVSERVVEFGGERLFGIVCEPVEDLRGPLVVMFNVAIEEHTGPSRLWVELSRRWAGYGIRSVRFDMRGIGDSPWPPVRDEDNFFNERWFDDIKTVVHDLSPDDTSNSVFIGMCSGAYWAIEAALEFEARGVCVINPPPYIDYLHAVRAWEASRNPVARQIGVRLKHFAKHPWMSAASWHLVRRFMPSSIDVDLVEKLAKNNIDLLLFYSIDEVWPYKTKPFFRSMDFRRLSNARGRQVEFIPGLDHGMHVASGRTHAVDLLDRHVLERFGNVARPVDDGPATPEQS